jgi:hypothetical protein
MPRKVSGGLNFHTGKDGLQRALNAHIRERLGLTPQQFGALPDEVRLPFLRRYYGSIGIPFEK